MISPAPQTPHNSFPLAEADLCVKCGLCLPHCPTYLDSGNEADSPRGRIMLMQGLATARIVLSPALESHLDSCLGCRACERVCPATVPYGALIDAGREQLALLRPHRLKTSRLISGVLTRRPLRRLLALALWAWSQSGVQALVRRSGVLGKGSLARLESTLPRLPFPRRRVVPTVVDRIGSVQIFTGCVGEIGELELASDLAILLADCGYQARITKEQTCCGAIDQHAGNVAAASGLSERNIKAFGDGADVILPLATGCAATLLDYPRLAGNGGAAFAKRVQDPLDFLQEHGARLRFKPLPMRVAIHEACTQKNVIRSGRALRALLARIPKIELVELDAAASCCGAAGTYFLSAPEPADRLLQPKLDAAARLVPQIIVSANIGCTLHLAAGLRRAGINSQVLHPLRLLARCRVQPPVAAARRPPA